MWYHFITICHNWTCQAITPLIVVPIKAIVVPYFQANSSYAYVLNTTMRHQQQQCKTTSTSSSYNIIIVYIIITTLHHHIHHHRFTTSSHTSSSHTSSSHTTYASFYNNTNSHIRLP